MGPMKFRAFISADIAPNEKLVSLLRQLAMSRADLKVVRPELLHVTLKFMGDTEESMVDQIEELIKGCAKGVLPFTVRLRGMGAFPSMSNIRVVWVGMEDAQPLGQIANRLDDSLKALGFEGLEGVQTAPHSCQNQECEEHRKPAGDNQGECRIGLRRLPCRQHPSQEKCPQPTGSYLLGRSRDHAVKCEPENHPYSLIRFSSTSSTKSTTLT